MEEYTYSAEWSEEGQKFSAKCFEYPCLRWFAETEEKAIEGIKFIVAITENQFASFLHAQ